MDKDKCKRFEKPMKKNIPINIKIDKNQSKFIADNKYSPTGIFNEALKKLGYKEK